MLYLTGVTGNKSKPVSCGLCVRVQAYELASEFKDANYTTINIDLLLSTLGICTFGLEYSMLIM